MNKKLGRLTFETIRVVYNVLKKRNMTLVSHELGMTQPAVTFHVRKFEDILGRKVINRVGNNLITSEESARIAELCEAILNRSNDLEFFSNKTWDRRKKIGVCAHVFPVLILQSQHMIDLLDRYMVTVSTSSLLGERFNSGELHAVFRPIDLSEAPPELALDVPYRWAASDRLRQVYRGREQFPIILEGRKSASADLARNALEVAGAPYRVMAEVSDFESLRVLVEAGVGYALMPEFRMDHLDLNLEGDPPTPQRNLKLRFGLFYHKREIPLAEATDLFDEISSLLMG